MVLGERLRKLREGKYTQEELAEKMNVHSITISKWETGAQIPHGSRISELARVLGTTPAYLLGDTDNPDPTAELTMRDFSKKLNEEGVAQSFNMGQSNGMLFLKNGSYEVSVPDNERNGKIFWEIVSKMLDSVSQPKGGIDASMNIVDGGHSNNYHGNVVTAN